MKIGIDAHTIGHEATGNETYVSNLVRALGKVDGGEHQYTLYVNEPRGKLDGHSLDGRARIRWLRPSSPWLRIPFVLPFELRRSPVDVLHVQYILPPVLPRSGRVVTIHDISYEHFPDFFSAGQRLRNKLLVRLSARQAHVILAVSQYTKDDLVRTYGIDPEKIIVSLEAADAGLVPAADRATALATCRKYGVEGPFLLYLGNIQPRKNVLRLIEAYAALIRDGDTSHRLVIAGKNALRSSEVDQRVRQLGLSRHVIFTGYVPRNDLCALYRAADAFVFPSLFEGFGLPVLEAMACGTPVITSSVSSLPEVAGDAALYVDPYDIGDIALAIRTVVSDAGLRKRLSVMGLRQAARFSWEETARTTLAAYEMAFERSKGDAGTRLVTHGRRTEVEESSRRGQARPGRYESTRSSGEGGALGTPGFPGSRNGGKRCASQ